MSLQSQLRLIDSKYMNLERARHDYPGREVIETQSDIRYLQLQLVDEDCQQTTAFFNIDLWLNNMNSHLPEIPWQQVPADYLIRWLNTLQLSFLVENIIWNVESISQPEKPVPARLLALTAEPCTILCLNWPGHSEDESRTGFNFNQIPLNLRYILGTSQAELSVLFNLVPGDLVVIKRPSYYLAIGQCYLFSFSYQGNDEVIVDKFIFDNQLSERAEEGHLLDWTKVPVDIEFVLDNNILTLEKLNDINTGSILPVSFGAEQRIKIYLNRKFFALGELVALEGGGLAVEINQINLHPENEMSNPDVE
ncbi:FliM/FliN family flagellar motor switch protein [Klebsiella sp. BIGb0407]|uniref:FliM/FliN family flagellar motor switch protein n=1 Tax=Klebsiella sp. BIGb0407 TaxID=2940603 RepID=UPI0021673008|nr:FliM/FliN family flagellar motor switch protein [Klebsiella sp. BIGb0407]MCS3431543.1 type III secretion protein Q [Klebsiella sp. BIGb0407]